LAGSKEIIIIEIERDEKLWDETIVPKLLKFYWKYYILEVYI